MKKTIVYEPWAHGEAHAEFNKAFLQTLSFIYDEIVFWGEANHISVLAEYKYNKRIVFNPIKITNYGSLKGKITSVFREICNIERIKKENKSVDIFFSYGAAHSMLIAEKLLRNRKVFYVQHGQIELINRNLSLLNLNHYILPALRKLPAKHKIIVLADFIKDNLLKQCPYLEEKILSIDHPFISTDCKAENNDGKRDFSEINIGTIGVGTKDKGIELLNDLASSFRNKDTKTNFYHIGRIYHDVNIDEKLVKLPFKSESLIPREDFLQEISKLDFILFLYPKDSYKFTASGAIFDAFLLGKPVIALENDYFDYLFKKTANKIGFLCNDFEELKSQISKLKSIGFEKYELLSRNSFEAIKVFSPEIVSGLLKKQLGASSC